MTSIIRVKVYVRGKHGFHLGNLEPFWFLAGIGSSIFRLSMAIVDVTTVHDQRSLLRRIEGHYRLVYDQGIACDDLGTLGRRIPLLPFESSDLFFFQFPHVFHVLPLAGLFFQFRLADVTFHDRTCPGGRMSGGPGAFAFVETVIPSWRWTLLLLSLLLLLTLWWWWCPPHLIRLLSIAILHVYINGIFSLICMFLFTIPAARPTEEAKQE
mmetsp:Transcript_6806/g.10237  ORF Transcript_6806/g.10237 Transcript_6806/m.10237 type:complete len:211 (+) Transcript_6806:751-1383(+)